MAKEDNICSIQLISGDGEFDVGAMKDFSKKNRLGELQLSYGVVSIIGPQGSGKSTLLNHLFGTKFRVMDATVGRDQTTRGIWLAKAADIDPCTLVFDVEGSDGREKGENVKFERQSALFALAMSDVLLINLVWTDFGREQAGGRTLLKTVFEVMMCNRVFTQHRRTLLFVIRNKSPVTPLEIVIKQIQEDVQKIYDGVSKPENHLETELSYFFDVCVRALPNYEERRKEFEKEVVSLRDFLIHSTTTGGSAGDQGGRVPASGIPISAQELWEQILKNKHLDLPALKTMVATVRCDEILKDEVDKFVESEDWRHLEDTLKSRPVSDFGKQLTSMIDISLSKYDSESLCFDEDVRSAKRCDLQEKLLQRIQPAYQSMLDHLHRGALNDFKLALPKVLDSGEDLPTAAARCCAKILLVFGEGCKGATIEQANWGPSNVLSKLQSDINEHIALFKDMADAVQKASAEAAASKKKMEALAASHALAVAKCNKALAVNKAEAKAEAAAVQAAFDQAVLMNEKAQADAQKKIHDLKKIVGLTIGAVTTLVAIPAVAAAIALIPAVAVPAVAIPSLVFPVVSFSALAAKLTAKIMGRKSEVSSDSIDEGVPLLGRKSEVSSDSIDGGVSPDSIDEGDT